MSYTWFTADEIASWPTGSKRCRGCDQVKSFECFTKQKNTLFGLATKCKECRKPERVVNNARWQNKPCEYRLWSRAQRRAKMKAIPFTITLEDIQIPELCPVFGKPLIDGDKDWAPSLDQHVPRGGYVPGNVVVMSRRANLLKNNASLQELVALVAYMELE